jgi:IS5 family transposase
MQRAESHARRRNLLDLGPQDYVTQLVYVHQLHFRGMKGPEWHFRRSGNVRDRPPRLAAPGPALGAASEALGALPEGASVHRDRGYDPHLTRERLAELGLRWEISGKGKPVPF